MSRTITAGDAVLPARDVAAAAVELLAELVGIDSVNPGLVPGAAGETAIVARLRRRLDRSGFATTVVEAPGRPGRPSLVAIAPGAADRPYAVLNGHLDTVGVEGMGAPFTPRVEGDRLYGRGAADMKGGVAALVAAAERLASDPAAPVRPVLALVADEEDASLGSEAVIPALASLGVQPEICLIAEPTGLELCRTLRGFAVLRVSFPGRAAHSSQPELGVNAVTHLGRFLARVDAQAAEIRASGGDLMVTRARGGSSAFVVPDHAECLLELRIPPSRDGIDPLALTRSLLDPAWDATVELVARREPWRVDEAGPAADLARRLSRELGTEATFDAPYWMEAPLWQQVCPTVICGPTGGGMHAADEWVDLRQVRAFADGLVRVLSDFDPHDTGPVADAD